MGIKELKQKIEEQRNKNIKLYSVFEHKMNDKNMQAVIDEWRLGSERLKRMLAELQVLELEKSQKDVLKSNTKIFVNGFGDATKREIATTTYKRAEKRLSKQIISFLS